MALVVRTVSSLADVSASAWDSLTSGNPALAHAYFRALEECGCASPETGWIAQHLLAFEGATLVGAVPLYFKTHSYGEFVFDWAWAEAYERHGLKYYPKLVSAVPFTPISGARVLGAAPAVRSALTQAAWRLARESGVSSLHFLFPPEAQARELAGEGLMLRKGLQFHWRNEGYRAFDDFLATLRHDKRKKIRQERRRLREAGITWERIESPSAEDWAFFYECYLHTHRLYESPVPLTLEFFTRLGSAMPRNILLVIGSRAGRRIAAAFDLLGPGVLYGRSWGALEFHPGLHFEACYYQAMEFCLERGIALFEGGAQGEHKLARGFLPETTWSAHWLAHPEFARAVGEFLEEETTHITHAMRELGTRAPFRH
ncbi:MAG: GNAT family N-acetyltransferase [Bdellovibrionota bacterium]